MSVEQLIDRVDRGIDRLIPEAEPTAPFYGMLKYHLGWVDEHLRPSRSEAGKRIRARLCLLVCEAVGTPPEEALPPATAVELIHNFSLIHDDIQDRSELRRHRRTVWALWGEAQAINAGDSMFTLAQLALAEDRDHDPRVVVEGLRELNRTCRALCEGQYLDLHFERRPSVDLVEYFAMIQRKTAALLESCCYLGALYGGADDSLRRSYATFGRYLGLAFQIQDDYLGIWGDPARTGKPAASDIASKKKTFPLLWALGHAEGSDRARLEALLSAPGSADEAETASVLDILNRWGVADHTAAEVSRLSQMALDALASARPAPRPRAELSALCVLLLVRTK
jgi:geranylgeranyl diphosphate synthase type I